jgi:hypothetical protein
MTYVVTVPFDTNAPVSESDPDVRSLSRLPGFIGLKRIDGRYDRYELTYDVEGGSLRDAMDAADELLVEYENALGRYHPKMLATVAPQVR